jgi:hypothetical protein
MKLEDALAITLAFSADTVAGSAGTPAQSAAIECARRIVRDRADAVIGEWTELCPSRPVNRRARDANPNPLAEAITEHWGKRCDDFDETCPCCQAWRQYDDMAKAIVALDQDLPCEVTVAPATRFSKGVKVGTMLAALDRRRVDSKAQASNLNENNSVSPSEPVDFEQEGIRLAERAAQWSGDWCEFAELVHRSLSAAYARGLRDVVGVDFGKLQMEAKRV